MIIATHNPNIVVNADTDLVVSLEFANGQVEDVREEICRIAEGGRAAFEARYSRIGERRV